MGESQKAEKQKPESKDDSKTLDDSELSLLTGRIGRLSIIDVMPGSSTPKMNTDI
jgi:hypothetical protein